MTKISYWYNYLTTIVVLKIDLSLVTTEKENIGKSSKSKIGKRTAAEFDKINILYCMWGLDVEITTT